MWDGANFPLVAPREFLTEQRKEFKHVPELESKKSLWEKDREKDQDTKSKDKKKQRQKAKIKSKDQKQRHTVLSVLGIQFILSFLVSVN